MTFNVEPDMQVLVDALLADTKSESMEELLSSALELLQWAVDRKRRGYKIVAVRGEHIEVLAFAPLEVVTAGSA